MRMRMLSLYLRGRKLRRPLADMIKSINLKNVATYDEQGVHLNDLKKVNFIYGANGCGKTTISNFVHDCSDEKFSSCSLTWNNDLPLQALVYNKAFRERNYGKGKLSGVFTLGEATAEQIKLIEKKNEELQVVKEEGIQKRDSIIKLNKDKEDLDNSFREDTWTKVYKKHEVVFKEAFVGALQKELFKNKILNESSTNSSPLEPLENLKKKATTIFGEQPQSLDTINSMSFERILEIEKNPVWAKIIVGKGDVDIARLIQRLNINDWVNQGREYIEGDTCPFCQQQTITDEFKKQIESYFDESYLNDIKLLKELKEEYQGLNQNIINQLEIIEANHKELKNTKLEIDNYSAFLKTWISQSTANNAYVNNKLKEPSKC